MPSHEDSIQARLPAITRFALSPTRSTPQYTSFTTILTEAEFQARMRALLDELDTKLDLNDTQMDFSDSQLDHYDVQLDLEEDECDES